jgi:sulfonate transport system substrate-binding protein
VFAARPLLRIGTFKGGDSLLLQLAGLLEPSGFAFSEFASGNLIVEALAAQAIDLGSMSQIPVAFASIARAPVKVIATIKGDVNEQVVLVPGASTARTIFDLKGKRVGYVRATTAHYFLLEMLKQEGLGFSDIVPINLSPSDGQTAFASGALDAFAIYGYVGQRIQQAYGARVLRNANGILSGDYLYTARPEALKDAQARAGLEAYLRAVRKALSWREHHREEYSLAISQTLGFPLEVVAAIHERESQPRRLAPIDDRVIATTQEIADTFFEAGLIPKRGDVEPLFDRSFAALLGEKDS